MFNNKKVDEILEILKNERIVNTTEARIYREYKISTGIYFHKCYSSRFGGIDRASFISSVIGRDEVLCERIKELEDEIKLLKCGSQ